MQHGIGILWEWKSMNNNFQRIMIIYVDYNDDDIDNDNQDKLNDSRTNLVNI